MRDLTLALPTTTTTTSFNYRSRGDWDGCSYSFGALVMAAYYGEMGESVFDLICR